MADPAPNPPLPDEPDDDRDREERVDPDNVRRLNKKPIIIVGMAAVLVLGVMAYGLTTRNQPPAPGEETQAARAGAADFARDINAGAPRGMLVAGQPVPPALANIDPAASPTPQPVPGSPGAGISEPPVPPPDRAPPALTPAQEYRRERLQAYYNDLLRAEQGRRQAAAEARGDATQVRLVGADGQAAAGAGGPSANPLAALAQLAGGAAPGVGGAGGGDALAGLAGVAGLPGSQEPDPNLQGRKEGFLERGSTGQGYLQGRQNPAISPFELKRGSVIPAVMITGINSDLPGRIIGQVSENVYDTVTGRTLLVPQGTRLFGRYDSRIANGQSRVLVVWTDLIFPNGSTLDLDGMAGVDQAGYAGFKDKVDNHFDRVFGTAILLSLIGAGTEALDSSGNQSILNQDSLSDSARQSFAREFGRTASRVIDRNLDIQPTLTIRPGYRLNVIVEKDIILTPIRRVSR